MVAMGGLKKALSRLVPLTLLWCGIIGDGCDHFFPASGTYIGVPLRSTPQGVVTQFQNAYQNISLSLYQDLLPTDGSFKFYVAPGFVAENPVSLTQEPWDTTMHYVGGFPYYYYWTQDIELKSEYALFENALAMQFITPLSIAQSRQIIDSLGNIDSEVQVTGELYITFNDPDTYPNQDILINCDFLLTRDSKNLWVIKKWYDLQGSS